MRGNRPEKQRCVMEREEKRKKKNGAPQHKRKKRSWRRESEDYAEEARNVERGGATSKKS
jgi:type III secretory pathway component EscU